jgi:hypothetical protein
VLLVFADVAVPHRCNSDDSPFYRALTKIPARLKNKRRLADATPRYWLFADGEGAELTKSGVVVDARTGVELGEAPNDASALVENPRGELLGFWHLDGQFMAWPGHGKSWPNPGVWHLSIDGNFFFLSGASTLLDGNTLYVAHFWRKDSRAHISAYDFATAKKLWTTPVAGLAAEPSHELDNDIRLARSGGDLVVRSYQSMGCSVTVIDAATGRVK